MSGKEIVLRVNESADSAKTLLKKCKDLSFRSLAQAESRKTLDRDAGIINITYYHNTKLRELLMNAISLHRWADVAAIVSVLLRASLTDFYFCRQHLKHWAVMEALRQLEGVDGNKERFARAYSMLKKKQPSFRRKHANRRSVRNGELERVLFLLVHGQASEAFQTSKMFMQESLYQKDSTANIVYGFVFYQLWYEGIVKDMNLTAAEIHTFSDDMEIAVEENGIRYNDPNSVSCGLYSPRNRNMKDQLMVDSDSSIGNGNGYSMHSSIHSKRGKFGRVHLQDTNQSDERNIYQEMDEDLSDNDSDSESFIVLCSPGMDKKLFPIKLSGQEGHKYIISTERINITNYRREALRRFELALSSAPQSVAALLPYLQLLLSDGQVREAWNVVQNIFQNTKHILPASLRARLADSFSPKCFKLIAESYEDALRRNPASEFAMMHLVKLHKRGFYSRKLLMDNIALHLDATYGSVLIWKEMAFGFSNIQRDWQCENELDRLSTEQNKDEPCIPMKATSSAYQIPAMFSSTDAKGLWKLRCKWWVRKHFGKGNFQAEKENGNWELLTFKAVCASHIFGTECGYVLAVVSMLTEESNESLLSILSSLSKSPLRIIEGL